MPLVIAAVQDVAEVAEGGSEDADEDEECFEAETREPAADGAYRGNCWCVAVD